MRHLPMNACVMLLTLAPTLHAQAPGDRDAEPNPAAPAHAPVAPAHAAPASAAPASGPAEPSNAEAAPTDTRTKADGTPAPLTPPFVGTAAAPGAAPTRGTAATPRARIAAASAGPAAAPASRVQASTATEPNALELDDGPPVEAAPLPTVSAWLGIGSLWIPSDGLDPFASDDALIMFSAGAALSLAQVGALDVAAVAGWDITSTDESYRGEATSLGLMRFALGPELRGSIIDRLFWHGRVAPTLTRLAVDLDETSSNATLSQSRWLWGAEAAVGLDFRFAQAKASETRAVGIFVRLEGGYAWSASSELSLEASGSGAPVRTSPLELGELALAGPSFKASVGAGF